jgi:hypothetical protein
LNFRAWLIHNFADEASANGDLVRDVREDDDWPTHEPESLQMYVEHIEDAGGIDEAVETLELAWQRYETCGCGGRGLYAGRTFSREVPGRFRASHQMPYWANWPMSLPMSGPSPPLRPEI